ncbi:hypothetical protein AR1Y2_3327 [Anaerostipes rhamnosivorans]|uniref:Uncharacterized protein n=1 Tax=Anaerostipes rhamnosivorans TaxID=1229621 RepID=A0A4P8IIA6_9FIRM|nr:hypothetical protein AR1Y2_3327 [Anaerostipes rhamnosivorans]
MRLPFFGHWKEELNYERKKSSRAGCSFSVSNFKTLKQ